LQVFVCDILELAPAFEVTSPLRIQRRGCQIRPHALVCEASRRVLKTKIKQNIPKNIPQERLSVVFHRFLAASFAISVRRSGGIFAARRGAARPASSRRGARYLEARSAADGGEGKLSSPQSLEKSRNQKILGPHSPRVRRDSSP
jgi:hypothetical protein